MRKYVLAELPDDYSALEPHGFMLTASLVVRTQREHLAKT